MSDSLVTFENLQHYDSKIKTKISELVSDRAPAIHSHELSRIIQSDEYRTTNLADINRLAGFRMCETKVNVSGPVQLNTNNFDMFYLTLSGAITSMQILDTATDAAIENSRSTLARHIKIIIKNPSAGITWPSSIVWMNGTAPSYPSGYTDADVDVFDLFTPDGEIWFGHYMQKWTI